MAESYVQVAADGSGKKIRNITVQTYVDVNGVPTLTDVYMQVASIADEFGIPIDFERQFQLDIRILKQLQRIESLLAAAFDLSPQQYLEDDTLEPSIDHKDS